MSKIMRRHVTPGLDDGSQLSDLERTNFNNFIFDKKNKVFSLFPAKRGFKFKNIMNQIKQVPILIKPGQQTVEFSEKSSNKQLQACFITGCGSTPNTVKPDMLSKTRFITPASTGEKQSDVIGSGPTQSGISKGALTPFTSPAGIALSIGGLIIFLAFFGSK